MTKKYTKLIDKNYTPASNETQWKNILNIYEGATSSYYNKYIDNRTVFNFSYRTSNNSISIYDYNTSTDAVYQIVNDEYKKDGKIITKEEYDEVLNSNNKFADMFNYNSFKDGYDIINDTYNLASYTLNGETITDVEIRLNNNKLKDIYYTDSQGHIVNYHFIIG